MSDTPDPVLDRPYLFDLQTAERIAAMFAGCWRSANRSVRIAEFGFTGRYEVLLKWKNDQSGNITQYRVPSQPADQDEAARMAKIALRLARQRDQEAFGRMRAERGDY